MNRPFFKAILSVVVLTGSLFFANTSTAQAAQGCGGNLLASYVYAGGYAQVDVYLENGTTNCLVNRTRGDSWGQARWMGVGVGLGSTTWACDIGQINRRADLDCGNYHYYAGPIRIYAPHTCISFWAGVTRANRTSAEAHWWDRHCG